MLQPSGFEASDKNLVCKLHKALYDLKQAPHAWHQGFIRPKTAPHAWHERLIHTLILFGFTSNSCDPSFYVPLFM